MNLIEQQTENFPGEDTMIKCKIARVDQQDHRKQLWKDESLVFLSSMQFRSFVEYLSIMFVTLMGKIYGWLLKWDHFLSLVHEGAQLQNYIDATLGSGNLREAIRLPPREYINEWLAVNTVDFFNQVNILHGTLTEFCTLANCPSMTAGPKYEYRWADGVTIKKPIEVSAPKYVEYLMDWIEVQLDEESIFPHKLGAPFPPNFQDVVKTIFKRLFWVYAHIYHTHFQKIVSLKEEAHLNTCFKHFVLFTWVFMKSEYYVKDIDEMRKE